MKTERFHGMWVGDKVIVGVDLGVRRSKTESRKNMLFGEVYTVYGIRSLFQGHSPGGAIV